jgi:hypothetical protein
MASPGERPSVAFEERCMEQVGSVNEVGCGGLELAAGDRVVTVLCRTHVTETEAACGSRARIT